MKSVKELELIDLVDIFTLAFIVARFIKEIKDSSLPENLKKHITSTCLGITITIIAFENDLHKGEVELLIKSIYDTEINNNT